MLGEFYPGVQINVKVALTIVSNDNIILCLVPSSLHQLSTMRSFLQPCLWLHKQCVAQIAAKS